MSKNTKREASKQFSVTIPLTLIQEIDTICAANFSTRTAWMVKAAREKLENDRALKTQIMIEKMQEENN